MAIQAVYPRFKAFIPGSNAPNSGGLIYTCRTGTTNDPPQAADLQASYTDATGNFANANPVVLDSNGEADIWLLPNTKYRIVVYNSSGTTKYADINNIVGIADLTSVSTSLGGQLTISGNLNMNGFSIVSTNNSNINLTPNGTGSVQIKNGSLSTNLDTNNNNIIFYNGNGFIDNNGNPLCLFGVTSGAVNGIKITNAATGNSPSITASGTDSNITLSIAGKGSGTVKLNSMSWPSADGPAGSVLVTNGAGVMSFSPGGVSFCRGYIDGLTTSLGGTFTFTVNPGVCTDSTNAISLNLASAMTKNASLAWTAGNNGGAYPHGTSLGNTYPTWAHIFIIGDNSSHIDIGIDFNTTATNLLAYSGYTYYRRIFSIYCNGSGTSFTSINPYTQILDICLWNTPITDIAGSNSGVHTVSTPNGVVVEGIFNIQCASGIAGVLNNPSVNSSSVYNTYSSAGISACGNQRVFTNTSSQISVTSSNITVSTLGWVDPRGRNS